MVPEMEDFFSPPFCFSFCGKKLKEVRQSEIGGRVERIVENELFKPNNQRWRRSNEAVSTATLLVPTFLPPLCLFNRLLWLAFLNISNPSKLNCFIH